jgi:type I restriction enzyme S subunit
MAGEREEVCLNDVALATDYVANGSFASLKENVTYRSTPDYAVLVRTVDFNNSWNGDYVWLDQHSYEFLSKSNLDVGDLVLSNVGSVGVVFRVPDLGRPMTLGPNAVMCRTRNPAKLDQRFLFYYFSSADGQQALRSITSGSVQPKFNKTDFRGLKLPLPPLSEQKAIAAVLGALDDKIELNRRMNATLEAMARALFQSWFVDFDPVRAKLDGRQFPNLDPATAALFPDSFQESELGHIPEGWTIQPVGEVVDCVGGGTPSTAEPKYWEGGTQHWTTPKDFSSLQAPVLLDTDRKLTDAGIAKISSGLLPAGTLLLSSRAPVGYLAIAAMPVAINQGFIALKCNERASNFFMLNWCQANMAEIESRATGTTFAEISKQNFRPIRVVLPPKELMAAFTAKVSPLYAQITANLHQSRTLATLRDMLLPKLLSGELNVTKFEN